VEMPKGLGKIFERRAQSQCSEFSIRAASEERRIISKTTNAGRQSRNAEAENRKFPSAVRFVFRFFWGRPCGHSIMHCLPGALHCLQAVLGKLYSDGADISR